MLDPKSIVFIFLIIYFLHPVHLKVRQFGKSIVRYDQNPLQDWSQECTRNAVLENFLTLGMGQSDTLTVLISHRKALLPNCTLRIATSEEADLILCIEFIDNYIEKKNINCNQTHIYVVTGLVPEIRVCDKVNLRSHKYHTSIATASHSVNVRIYGLERFDSVKVTATTARPSSDGECDKHTETKCERIDSNVYTSYCMTVEVTCDGHYNCGLLHKFDEDELLCNVQSPTFYVLVAIVVLLVIVVLMVFLMRLLYCQVPRVGTNFFVFNEDEDNRLNLASVFTTQDPTSKQSITSHSSSYYFRTSPLPDNRHERERGKSSDGETVDSEVELRSNVLGTQRLKPTKILGQNDIDPSVKNENKPILELGSQPEVQETKKQRIHIAPAEIEVIPDFTTLTPLQDLMKTDEEPKSILGHKHDNKPFPTFANQGTSKNIAITKKKKHSLSKVRSSKDLISKKIHARDQDEK